MTRAYNENIRYITLDGDPKRNLSLLRTHAMIHNPCRKFFMSPARPWSASSRGIRESNLLRPSLTSLFTFDMMSCFSIRSLTVALHHAFAGMLSSSFQTIPGRLQRFIRKLGTVVNCGTSSCPSRHQGPCPLSLSQTWILRCK